MNRDIQSGRFKTIKAIMNLQHEEEQVFTSNMIRNSGQRTLAIKCPNDQELGKEVRELIKKYKLNTNTNR